MLRSITILSILAITHVALAKELKGRNNLQSNKTRILFTILISLHNLTYSVSISAAMWHYGLSAESGVLMLFIAVAAVAGIIILAAHPNLQLLFLASMIVPTLITVLFFSKFEPLIIVPGFGLYVFFLLLLGHRIKRADQKMAMTQASFENPKNESLVQYRKPAQPITGQTENRLLTFLIRSPDPVAVIRDNKVIFVNEAAAQFLHRDAESLIDPR
ncbi:MAG: hypothetical protein ABGY96_30860 [bacterium]|nr:hypothetical protein [Gammaproteobacteria bacterium]HIL95282.1 hypothetical protein [Pseudomonadales bacterium]